MATYDQETAESCIYALPRGKEPIKGPSIRLAEIMQCAWGNMHVGGRVVANDGKSITAEGVAWDLEKNVKVQKEVKRSIKGKNGTYSDDMQNVTGNAAISIAIRNSIFGIIPQAFVKRVYEESVQAALGDQKTRTSKISALFSRFQKMGINQDKILTYFNKKTPEEINAEEMVAMIGFGTAIKDGSLSIDKAFTHQPVAESKSQSIADEIDASDDEWKESYDNATTVGDKK